MQYSKQHSRINLFFRKIDFLRILSALFLFLFSGVSVAQSSLSLEILDEEINVQHYPAIGDQLIIYIAPSYGFNERWKDTAKTLSDGGIEIWMVDLIDSLFKTHSVDSIREFEGKYIANLIEKAYEKTGKHITLLSSSYGAIPLLRGARQWQLNNPQLEKTYLNGAIMFSPELFFQPWARTRNLNLLRPQQIFP